MSSRPNEIARRGKNQRFRRRAENLQASGATANDRRRATTHAQAGFSAKMRYRFDNLLARGPIALIGLLAIFTLIIIILASAAALLFRVAPAGYNLPWMLYWALLHSLDTGTVAGDTGPGWYLLIMVLVTIGGIFIVSALIGVITTGLDNRLADLRRGRSRVIEQNHTLILGWSPQIFTIVSELVEANSNQKKPVIVVLADRDKVEMEDEIHNRVEDLKNTRVVCRTGKPLDLAELEIASPETARSIIILAPQTEEPDTQVIMTLLAVTNHPRRSLDPYHIVAEIRDPKNLEVASMVGGDEAKIILNDDVIARITAQTCRQSGLSVVYTELLDFEGDEIYFQEEPALAGKTFGDALLAYEDSAVIGLQRSTGETVLNPPMDTTIEAGDRIIAVSSDDDTLVVSSTAPDIDESLIGGSTPAAARPERTLILGWNSRLPVIVQELDQYVALGSMTTIVAGNPDGDEQLAHFGNRLANQRIDYRHGDTTSRTLLDDLHIPEYQHVIVLSEGDPEDPEGTDARTLITLLHLRDIQEQADVDLSIVSEMVDVRNRELAQVTRADDFVVSDQLVSLLMTQISENPYLHTIFTDILNAEGSEVYMKPIEEYVQLDRDMTFYTVLEAARRKGQVALGYRKEALSDEPSEQFGVKVNPKKSDTILFELGDRLIVLSED